jgi:uncharacterized protein YlxP (DUF503 family)
MHLLLLRVELHLPFCHSLKEKRGIIKPLLNDLRADFNISVAEIDHHDVWQSSALAIVGVSGLREALERMERQVVEHLDTLEGVQVGEIAREWL